MASPPPFINRPDSLSESSLSSKKSLTLNSSTVVLPESVWLDVAASLFEGFLRINAVSGADLASLEACELLSRHIDACSGAMSSSRMGDCPRKISVDDQIFVILVSGVCKWWQDRLPDLLYFFQKVNTEM